MTQSQLARELRTTQQTIARWESGQTDIPLGHLKDIAVFFGRSVDDLLGVKHPPRQRRAGAAPPTSTLLFGSLKVRFAFAEREYPIDRGEEERLRRSSQRLDISAANGPWFEFVAMDNRLVFLNLDGIHTLELISDDAEGAPFFASRETYRSFFGLTPSEEIGPLIAEEREELIRRLAPDEPDAAVAQQKAHAELESLRIVFLDGKTEVFPMSDAAATSVQVLQNSPEVGRNALLAVDEEGNEVLRAVNLSRVAVIEVPLEAYLQTLSDDVAG
jgi:transcriptional regulator with XRE-family HTH domain